MYYRLTSKISVPNPVFVIGEQVVHPGQYYPLRDAVDVATEWVGVNVRHWQVPVR